MDILQISTEKQHQYDVNPKKKQILERSRNADLIFSLKLFMYGIDTKRYKK